MGQTTDATPDPLNGASTPSSNFEGDTGDHTTRIRAQIEGTRAGMSETISALQDKISPDRFKEDAGTLTEQVTGQVKEQVHETVGEVSAQVQEVVQQITVQVTAQLQETTEKISKQLGEQVHETVQEVTENLKQQAQETVLALGEQAQETVLALTEQVKEGTRQTVRAAGEEAREQVHHTVRATQDAVRAATIGKVQIMLHNASESLKDSAAYAAEAVHSAADAAREIAHSATDAVKETAHSATEAVKDTAQAAAGAVGFAAHAAGDKAHDAADAIGDKAHDAGEAVSEGTRDVVEAVGYAGHVAAVKTREAGHVAKEKGSSLLVAIKENPLPAALIGIGLTWLLTSRSDTRTPAKTSRTGAAGVDIEAGRTVREAVAETVPHTPRVIDVEAETNAPKAAPLTGRVQEKASQVADRAYEHVEHLGERVHQGAEHAEGRFQQSLQENPLAVGAALLALGTAVGLAAPSTRAENKLMGETHEKVMEKVGVVAHDTAEKVQHVAGEATRAAQKEAEYQGLIE